MLGKPVLGDGRGRNFKENVQMQAEPYIIDDPANSIFRVNRVTMTSDDVLAREWDEIFGRNWLYVGHESELAQPGEYRRRTVGGRPLFFVRGRDGAVRAFHN